MTWLRGLALAAVLGAAGGGAQADEPPRDAAPGAKAAVDQALEHGLAALRTRVAAKLKEAELLQQAGKLEEALAATRDVERLYREGMADLERLLGVRAGPQDLPREPGAPEAAPRPDAEDWDSSVLP